MRTPEERLRASNGIGPDAAKAMREAYQRGRELIADNKAAMDAHKKELKARGIVVDQLAIEREKVRKHAPLKPS